MKRDSNPWLSHDHAFAIKSGDLHAAEFRKRGEDSNFRLHHLTERTLTDEAQTGISALRGLRHAP
jgi:hypothetical protein